MATNKEIIYNLLINLPSPCVDKVDPLGLYDDLFAPLRGSDPIEGMVTPLHQHQRAAVTRMLHQELYPPGYVPTLGELPLDTYPPELRSEPITCPYDCGKHHYSPAVNSLPGGMKTIADTTTVRTRGGILAENSLTDQILEFLALILLTKDQLACPTALDVAFTKMACHLTYQNYLEHTLFPPHRYPSRNAKRNAESNNGDESDEDEVKLKNRKVTSSCLPGEEIVPPLRYLALREIVHCPRLARKALGDYLPPDLQKLLWFLGFSHIKDHEFAAAYFKNPRVPIADNVEQHHQDLIMFTKATPDILQFKTALALVSSQGPKNWN
ncbi:hypothetical protein IWQ61_004159 [Dispira simplex]|nr:hypothetical protein IWQ61_004159 [Dispira simplex]